MNTKLKPKNEDIDPISISIFSDDKSLIRLFVENIIPMTYRTGGYLPLNVDFDFRSKIVNFRNRLKMVGLMFQRKEGDFPLFHKIRPHNIVIYNYSINSISYLREISRKIEHWNLNESPGEQRKDLYFMFIENQNQEQNKIIKRNKLELVLNQLKEVLIKQKIKFTFVTGFSECYRKISRIF